MQFYKDTLDVSNEEEKTEEEKEKEKEEKRSPSPEGEKTETEKAEDDSKDGKPFYSFTTGIDRLEELTPCACEKVISDLG